MSPSRLYVLAGLCGGLLMALEILASRILAPAFGNSVYLWGSIISVFLGALSLGYAWGGRLADRHPDLAILGRLVLAAGLWLLALRLTAAPATQRLADLTSASPGGTLLTATLLFGPPSVFFGAVTPFVVRLAARDVERLGGTAGRLFAVSTLGSLAGTLLCTFVAVPNLRVSTITAGLAAGTAVAAAIAFGRGRFRGEPLAAGLLALAALTLIRPAGFGDGDGYGDGDVLGVHSSAYQTIEVVESGGLRSLRVDRVTQSAVFSRDLRPASAYTHYAPAALLLEPELSRVVVIGMGGGLVSRTLRAAAPENRIEVDFVEIDAVVPKVAERYGFWTPREDDRVHIGDGRQFVRREEGGWSYLYVDAYIGLAVPFHLTTREFFELAADRLAPGGVVGVNLAAGLGDPFSRAVLHTMRRVFRSTYVVKVERSRNVLLLATDEQPLTFEQLADRAAALPPGDATVTLERIAGQFVDWQYDTGDLAELRDDYAPAEHLVLLGDRDFDLAVLGRKP